MNMSRYRATFAVISGLAMLSPATSSLAQQQIAPAAQQAPALSQAPAVPAQAAPPPQAQAPSAAAQSAPAPAAAAPVAPDASAAPADGSRPLKSTAPALRELSPWSMFLSADVLVKAVMIGLAFASLMTWTIFLAKSAHLFLARRRLRKALARVANTRTLTEAQLAAGRGSSLPASLVAAAIHEVRISSDSTANGIQARAASRFAEIVRAEARSARYGMGVLAMIGSTAPFVGLFGTVWGIMNSFIGISKAQT